MSPEEVIFFADRNLGKRFPRILMEAGIRVERHDDHFAQDTPDTEWLAEIGRRGWFVLTYDRRIRYKPNEREAVFRANVGLFLLVGKAPFNKLAENVVTTRQKILDFIASQPRPFIAKIHRPSPSESKGHVELWLSTETALKKSKSNNFL